MNALQLIEAEDPKSFLRHHAPARRLPVFIECPVQGREEEFNAEEGVYSSVIASQELIRILPSEAHKLDHTMQYEGEDGPIYQWQDFYVYEVLQYCFDHDIEVYAAWERYPDNAIMVDAYFDHLRKTYESEDPKRILRSIAAEKYPRFSADLAKPKIWASDNYFINLAKPEEEWAVGEFCPILIRQDGSGEAMDGMYGLSQDVSVAVGNVDDAGQAAEDEYVQGMDQYEVPMWRDIENGIVSGNLNGVAGPRKWRIVYVPNPHGHWDADSAVPVEPNRKYGEQLGRDEALEVVQRVLEGEDPKSVFRRMGGRENAVTVDLFRYGMDGRRELSGQVMLRPNGEIVPGTENLDKILHELGASRIQIIYRDLQRGRLNNSLWRTRWDWHVHGVEHYGGAPDHPAIRHFVVNKAPELVVTTRRWTVRLPLYVDAQPGHNYQLIFDASHLNRAQRKFFNKHGEMIWYAMNEGPGYEGAFYADEDEEEQHPIAEWRVDGNPEMAPETMQNLVIEPAD